MPYKIVKTSGTRPWKVVKISTGKVVGSSTSRARAEAAMRARIAGAAERKGR